MDYDNWKLSAGDFPANEKTIEYKALIFIDSDLDKAKEKLRRLFNAKEFIVEVLEEDDEYNLEVYGELDVHYDFDEYQAKELSLQELKYSMQEEGFEVLEMEEW